MSSVGILLQLLKLLVVKGFGSEKVFDSLVDCGDLGRD